MDPNKITYFGETDARNKKVRFGIKAKDRLKHMYVIGKTGMGKSTLLENLAIQDIQNGEGLAFIDPHGGTAEKLLDYVPESRIKDVLYFAPFDMEYPISFNVLEDIGEDKRHLVVNGLMSTFEKIWVDAWSARMAYILNNTLLALLEYPGATLLGVNRMLADKEYRKKVVANITDTSVKTFWIDEFGKWTEKFIAEAIPAIQNKVGQFTSNPLVRNLLGQSQSSFSIRKFMDEKKILIINMSKGQVGEGNARLIGSMLITKIYLAAMSRADMNEQELAKLPNFYLYVDEFQSFANKSFADILSEARKYKLSLTIAHQYIEQMEEEVRNAVFGNVGSMITFRVGAFDSEVLEKEFAPVFTAEDLVNLGFSQIYLKLMIDGVSSQPFSATTIPPIARPDITFKQEVIAASREQFSRSRAIVEKEIRDWYDEGKTEAVPQSQGEYRAGQNGRSQNLNPVPRGKVTPAPDLGHVLSRVTPPPAPVDVQPRQPVVPVTPAAIQPVVEHSAVIAVKENNPAQPDKNKEAFLKASEELRAFTTMRQAMPQPKVPPPVPREVRVDAPRPVLPTLASREDKKTPTKENVMSLKHALSSVLKKDAQPILPERPHIEPRPLPNPTKSETSSSQVKPSSPPIRPVVEAVKTAPNVPKESPKETPRHDIPPKVEHAEKKEEPKEKPTGHNTTPPPREIPEDVLRQLLDVDDASR